MKNLLISFIRVYQYSISPLLGGHCRYVPSCSEYFIQALKKRGFLKGTLLGLWRILRCNPFGGRGYDPVPNKNEPQRAQRTELNRDFNRTLSD